MILILTVLIATIIPLPDGPVHEAIAPTAQGEMFLHAVNDHPPIPLNERPPKQTIKETVWIPGYWAKHEQDYVWVCGVWRRPPTNYGWIGGYWKAFKNGWVWMHGFWSPVTQNKLEYHKSTPPAPLDEEVGIPVSKNLFWASGFWKSSNEGWQWQDGSWQPLQKNKVFVPGHYVWRPQGYTFIPPHWDHPLADVGQGYCAVTVNIDEAPEIFTPDFPTDTKMLVNLLYMNYPNHKYTLQHHFTHHQDEWKEVPTWWNWQQWWAFNGAPLWELWWWYTHPGYPHPTWLNKHMAEAIKPASKQLVKAMRYQTPPPTITPEGAIAPGKLMGQLGRLPIIPSDPAELYSQIQPGTSKTPLEAKGTITIKDEPKPWIDELRKVKRGKLPAAVPQ